LIGNTKVNISTNQGKLRVRSFTKLSEDRRILFLELAVKAKMLTFVLPTEKCLVVSF